MKYALLIYQDEGVYGETTDQDCHATHMAFSQILGDRRLGSAGLKSTTTATTVRGNGSAKAVHDGPFAETKEQLAGFYVIEAANLDEAIDIAKRVPQAGAIEIRPISSYID